MRNRPSAEILLTNRNKRIILQRRDNKPNITNPGKATTFGGTIELGETPSKGALREINEETNLNLNKEDLIFVKKYERTKEVDGEDNDLYCFLVENVDESKLEVYEGQGFEIANNLEDVLNANPSLFFIRIARDYFAGEFNNLQK